MKISPSIVPVPPIGGGGAMTLIRNGLMQNNMDAQGYQIENLDTSNLTFPGIPTQIAAPSCWFDRYDSGTKIFGFTQPSFFDIAGNLTSDQMFAINTLGTITQGAWRATPILPDKVPALDQIQVPSANVNLNSHRIVNMADPIDQQDAATLNILRQLSGQNPKAAVRLATTAPITHPPSGAQTIDGFAVVTNDRILIKNNPYSTYGFDHGIWIANTSGNWTRATDFDDPVDPPGIELIGASVFVLQGTVNANTTWFQNSPAPVYTSLQPPPRPGDPPIYYPVFVLIEVALTPPPAISAGSGLQLVGSVMSAVGTSNRIHIGTGIDIDSAYVGQGSITTLGTITNGQWNGTIIDPQFGGTGVDNTGKFIHLTGSFFTTFSPPSPPGSNLSFTLTGGTTLTLPVTGTVATLAGTETFTNKSIDASQITGTTSIAVGGTGANTAAAAIKNLLPSQVGHNNQVLFSDGVGTAFWALININNLLPPQAGHLGQTLHTDGTNLYWA